MISLKSLITEVKYDYGCVMAEMPQTLYAPLMAFSKSIISDDMLYFDPNAEPDDYGREKHFHTTIKFGLTESYTQEQMAEFLRGTRVFFVNIQGMDVFSNPEFDVVKLSVGGEGLNRLREVFNKLPNVDEHPIYRPHLTLAYVKRGLGERFKGKTTKAYSKVPVNLIKYSDRGTPYYFTLC